MNEAMLLGDVKIPIGVEVITHSKRAQLQYRFGTFDTPSSARDVHSVSNNAAAGTFDHAGGDGQAIAEILVIAKMLLVLQEVARAGVGVLALAGRQAALRCAPPDARSDVTGMPLQRVWIPS